MNGNVLAFIGDAVLSLQVREHLVHTGMTKTKELQETSTRYVSAVSQARFMKHLLDHQLVQDDEIDIYKRGRNASSGSVAKNVDVITYRIATGFEAMWGHLYLKGSHERLAHLWQLFIETVEHQNG